MRGVKNGPSPRWLQQRLLAIGLRPINALVDITNYSPSTAAGRCMSSTPPRSRGDLVVRRAAAGETVLALDGREYTLTPEMCVIADDNGVDFDRRHHGRRAFRLRSRHHRRADRIGAVGAAQRRPHRAAQLGIVTDARYRFERGVDPEFMVPGLELATRMVLDLCGGTPSEIDVVGYAGHQPKVVRFPTARGRSG